MNCVNQAPTINEIRYQRQDRIRNCKEMRQVYRFEKFAKGEKVAFTFSGMKRYGRITAIHHYGPMVLYSIVTPGGGWFRQVEECYVQHLTETL